MTDLTPKAPAPAFSTGITLNDVAREAGVSTSAVSRTFTPGASVGKKTRALVLEAANRLGYRPNAIARTLSTRKSRMIGLVVSYLDNQFYPTVMEQLSQRLQQHGYHVLLFIGRANEVCSSSRHGAVAPSVDIQRGALNGAEDVESTAEDTDTILMEILQYQVDAIVLASTMLSSTLSDHCRALGIPVVLFNRTAPVEGVSAVVSNNYEGGRLAAQHFLSTGAQRIGFIAGLEDASTSREREQGFMAALQQAGVSLAARAVANYSMEQARAVTRTLYAGASEHALPDALLVANDHMAFGVLDALRLDLGLRVPHDVQVIGFDNVPQAAWGGYQLTTIEQDAVRMVNATVDLLIRQLDSRFSLPPERIVMPVRMVYRATTRQGQS